METVMPDSEELVIFMTLERGVEGELILEFLPAGAFHSFCSINTRRVNGGTSRLRCPLRASKTLEGHLRMQSKLENPWTGKGMSEEM
jgi:hypothetical protein